LLNESNVHSGAITDSQVSILEINVELVRAGSVVFDWMVEAEEGVTLVCDGFYFEIDGVRRINVTSIADVTRSKFSLSAGTHTLVFGYRKDSSLSLGVDRAEIFMLEVEGIFWADSSCTPCPHGTYSTLGSADCTLCAENTASNDIGTPNACPACNATEYAFPGATQCIPRPVCTALHAEPLYSHCTYASGAHSRTKYWSWIEPHVCAGGYVLPPNQTGLACPDCQPGFRRLPGYGECVGCPDGQRVGADNVTCVPCDAGTYANKVFAISSWNMWPDWSHHVTMIPLSATLQHGCEGSGCRGDWRLMGSFVDSGVGHHFPATPYLNFTVDVETVPTKLIIGAAFSCGTEICQLVVRDYVRRNSTFEYLDSFWMTNLFFNSSHPGELLVLQAGVHRYISSRPLCDFSV
jgi:hypothetical protein